MWKQRGLQYLYFSLKFDHLIIMTGTCTIIFIFLIMKCYPYRGEKMSMIRETLLGTVNLQVICFMGIKTCRWLVIVSLLKH